MFADRAILRPYFTRVHAPSGVQVTRAHPPRPGIDAIDHDTMHPGIWLAFGDLGRRRLLAEQGPRGACRVRRAAGGRKTACSRSRRKTATSAASGRFATSWPGIRCASLEGGYLLTFDSQFSGDAPFAFGDQEEMGLGVRLATPLAVKARQRLDHQQRGPQEREGSLGPNRRVVRLQRHGRWPPRGPARRAAPRQLPPLAGSTPATTASSTANPFGRKAFTKGEVSRVEVKPGESLRLRFGIWIYAAEKPAESAEIAREYARVTIKQ